MDSSEPRKIVKKLARWVAGAGGRALLVGGSVRDSLLRKDSKDFDLEVFGLAARELEALLQPHFELIAVGRSFGVHKLRGLPIDVSLPRREIKRGPGHRGFDIEVDPFLDLVSAAARRDLTINAIYQDPLSEDYLDPLHGLDDLQSGVLRHCSDQFAEDPLRVLRVMQFAARFEFSVDEETLRLCSTLDLGELPRERIGEEWRKLLLQGCRPSLGLQFLADCQALRFFPEIEALVGTPQNPQWHPEGDVFVHTGHCLDHFARHRVGGESDWIVGLAVLCHDLGKPATTALEQGVWRSKGHSEAGEEPARSFLARLTAEKQVIEPVVALVREHLRPFELFQAEAKDSTIRRLATRVDLRLLERVARHDHAGRPPLPADDFPACDWLLQRADELDLRNQAPTPLVLGRHLIELGEKPGRHFSDLLQRCFEAQLDGSFSDLEGGKAYASELLRSG
jgi:tRNA nucleotidyltransferase (CCA-adding enzyme)